MYGEGLASQEFRPQEDISPRIATRLEGLLAACILLRSRLRSHLNDILCPVSNEEHFTSEHVTLFTLSLSVANGIGFLTCS